jgi:hydroxymethylglutaryl-CoA synthase
MTTYGSGAGSDAYSLVVTERLLERRDRAVQTAAYLARQEFVDYAIYAKWRSKLVIG